MSLVKGKNRRMVVPSARAMLLVVGAWLLPGTSLPLTQEQALTCQACESYTVGGETYWRCISANAGGITCSASAASCVESGKCPSAAFDVGPYPWY